MYYILCNVCKCIHICSMVIVFLQFRLGGLTKTRCWAIWPCTELDPGTKVILVMFHHCFHLHRHQATTLAVFLGSFLLLASTPSEFISSIMSFPWPCTVGRINYIWRDLGSRRSTFSTIAGLVKDNNKVFGWLGYFWQLQTGGGKHTDQEEHQQTQPGCDRLRCQPFSYQLQFWTYGEFWNSKFSAQITLKAV